MIAKLPALSLQTTLLGLLQDLRLAFLQRVRLALLHMPSHQVFLTFVVFRTASVVPPTLSTEITISAVTYALSLMGVFTLMRVMLPTTVRPLLVLLRQLLPPRSKRLTEAPSDLAGTTTAPMKMEALARFPTFLLRLTLLLFRRNSKTN